jgi:hypothetical protein
MFHYWVADETPAVRTLQLEDWLEDLVEFGPAIVAEACREWRHKPGGRRPTPGDIRTLCIETQRSRHEASAHHALPSPEYARLRAEDRQRQEDRFERARKVRAEIAAEYGYPNFMDLLKAGSSVIGRGRRRSSTPTAADLGVTAKDRTYTADELRRARIALGIEPAQQAAE